MLIQRATFQLLHNIFTYTKKGGKFCTANKRKLLEKESPLHADIRQIPYILFVPHLMHLVHVANYCKAELRTRYRYTL